MTQVASTPVVNPELTPKKTNGPVDRRYQWSLVSSFAIMILLWVAITGSGLWPPLVSPLFLPSPVKVFDTLTVLWRDGYQGVSLMQHIGSSVWRFAVAFAVSVGLGVPIGLVMGVNKTAQGLLDPPIEVSKPVPKLVLLPLLIIWFGIGEFPKVLIIVLALFPIMSVGAMQAVKGVSRRKINAAYALGASSWTVFRRVLLPASMPGILTSIRVSIGVGVTMLVGAEMIGTSSGIAFMAMSGADFMRTDVVLVGVLLMALLGYLLDLGARVVEARVVHWVGKQ
ncbi:ABC transporter permease [Variovorax boronicumulans]